MKCETCQDNGYIIVTRKDRFGTPVEAVKKCACRVVAKRAEEIGHCITADDISVATEALAAIPFYPHEESARLVVGRALAAMCNTAEQVHYTVERAVALFPKWDQCGVQGLRQVLCSRYASKDGIECTYTEAFPDGLPAVADLTPLPELGPAPTRAQIESGAAVSGDAVMDDAVKRLAKIPKILDANEKPARGPVVSI